MKIKALLLVALSFLALPLVASAEHLATEVTLLVGRPGDGGGEHGVLVVPGAVIPVASNSHLDHAAAYQQNEEERAQVKIARLQKTADNLKRSLRLSHIEVRYRLPLKLEVDEPYELSPPAGSSNVRLSVQLLGFNQTLASYEVKIHDGDQLIAHTPLSVERGKQAVVGGLDGDEAPYLFLVLEPSAFGLDATSEGPVYVGGDIKPPLAIHKLAAEYTPEAKEARIQGVVILETTIEKDGAVGHIKVLKGLPMGLTEAAVESIKQWQFEPATLNDQPIAVYYNLTINFRLE